MKFLVFLSVVASVFCMEIPNINEYVGGVNEFASKFYNEFSKSEDGNFIVSPFSALTILGLTTLGTKGETSNELKKGLVLPSDPEKIKEQFRKLKSCMISGRFSSLASANRIFIEKGFGITPDFLKVSVDDFGSGIENINFGDADAASKKINQWVENQTNGKIRQIVNSDNLNELTRVVLVNALYFKGQWFHQFKKEETKPMPFHLTKTDTVQTDTMQTVAYMKHTVNDDLKATFIELPYRGSEVVFTIVLPNEADGVADLEKNINAVLQVQNYSKDTVKLFLPKFKVEKSFNLVPGLQNLGIKKVFNRDADLSGISIREGLYVSQVFQKVFLDINEVGTEAAAATAVISNARSAINLRQPKLEIKVDRPFLFFLKLRDMVLFSGRVTKL